MPRRLIIAAILVVTILTLSASGCGSRPKPEENAEATPMLTQAPERVPVKVPDPTVDRTGWPVIVAFGDSLTAGQGVPGEKNYPSQLQAVLDERGYRYRIVNAGVSGELTSGGLKRVEAVLAHSPEIVILELGANDGLQERSPSEMKSNLAAIIEQLQGAGVTVLLTGMVAPPNFGPDYAAEYEQVFVDLAESYQLPFIPSFLGQVAGWPDLNLRDGIHPTADGYAIVVQTVMRSLEPLLKKLR